MKFKKEKSNYLKDCQIKNYLVKLLKLVDVYKMCQQTKIKKWINMFAEINQNCSEYTNKFIDGYLNYIGLVISNRWLSKKPSKMIKYDESYIRNKDLKCEINKIENNTFFLNLIRILNIDKKELANVDEEYKRNHNQRILNQYEDSYNSKFQEIKNLFNKLYCMNNGKDQYCFELRFNFPYLVFLLSKYDPKTNTKIFLDLEHQSTGFKWFFNFFFNVYASSEFKVGDIIIMDEPATNLHVKGQEELHDILKKFAMQSGITFVIATHSPFLVKLDYLDEVRLIIPQGNNTSYINNSFTTINPDDADSLLPIRESLTVRNNILLDPNQIIIFVEGITDYNYFVAMQKLIDGFDNLTFLPINGLGKMKQMKEKNRWVT